MTTTIQHRYDASIDVAADDAVRRAAYRYGATLPKPCVHPIVTPGGTCLTGYEMSDHVWHRGLWFAIKFINGENFWEEHGAFGVQSSIAEPTAAFLSPMTTRIAHESTWTSAASGSVFREVRTLDITLADDGVTAIDWTSTLTAERDLVLDRTPYTTWGGYGGLTFRASRELHGANFLLPGGATLPALVGDRHDWAVLQGNVDGGARRKVAIGMIDHPANPRGQTPWYGKAADGYGFFNAAFLFHEPMRVGAGETLTFRYRVLCRDGVWGADEFASLADVFRDA